MKKVLICFSIISCLSFGGCSDDPIISEPPEIDKEEEPEKTDPEKPDPLADVIYRIDGLYVLKDAYSSDTVFNIDGNYIREGSNKDGNIAYLVLDKFIYKGSEAKGMPKYAIYTDYKIYNFANYRAILYKDGNYLRKSSGIIPTPISHYWGEVAFNSDGLFIRQGRDPHGKVLFTRNGDYFYQGEGTGGSIAFNLDGHLVRLGSSKTGPIIFTIRDQYLYKGTSDNIISFNISGNYIRKGKATLAIGEN